MLLIPTVEISTDTPQPTDTARSPIDHSRWPARVRSPSSPTARASRRFTCLISTVMNRFQFTNESEGACQPDWSPDGEHLIFTSPCTSLTDTFVKTSIFRMNADGSGRTSLTKVPGGDYDPAWSPDGKRILVTSIQDGRQHIYVMDANGDKRILLSSTAGAIEYQARWSPDGERIILVSLAGSQPIIFTGGIDPENLWRTEFSAVPYTTMSPDWSVNNLHHLRPGSRGQVLICPRIHGSPARRAEFTPQYRGHDRRPFLPGRAMGAVRYDRCQNKNQPRHLPPPDRRGAGTPTDHHRQFRRVDPAWRPLAAGS